MSELAYYLPEIRLVSYTKPVIQEADTPGELLAFIARVSSPKNQELNQNVERLLSYLVKHKHWSPFDMVDVTLEFTVPRDITRQMIRHWSFKVQEFSQRYADPTNSLGFVLRECRMQDTANRQNSLTCLDPAVTEWWDQTQRNHLIDVEQRYNEALARGIAKEVARVLLPEGMTQSRLYFKGSIRSWITYLQVRTEEDVTQKEHVTAACEAEAILRELLPSVFDILQGFDS
jgi:thymidylate synthase (FAD)